MHVLTGSQCHNDFVLDAPVILLSCIIICVLSGEEGGIDATSLSEGGHEHGAGPRRRGSVGSVAVRQLDCTPPPPSRPMRSPNEEGS